MCVNPFSSEAEYPRTFLLLAFSLSFLYYFSFLYLIYYTLFFFCIFVFLSVFSYKPGPGGTVAPKYGLGLWRGTPFLSTRLYISAVTNIVSERERERERERETA